MNTPLSPERPGIGKRWAKSWKKDCENLVGWRADMIRMVGEELEYYVQHGKSKSRLNHPVLADDRQLPNLRGWRGGYVEQKMMNLGNIYLFDVERKGMSGEVFDVDSAVRAFAAVYTSEAISAWWHRDKRLPYEGRMDYRHVPFTALGVILGCNEQARLLAKWQVLAYRKGFYFNVPANKGLPIFDFILRLLADNLNQPGLELQGNSAEEPIFNALYELRYSTDIEVVAAVCLAACDYHTLRCDTPKRGDLFEFSMWFTRLPIEILLLFKLREVAGLQNPELDHPLMKSPLGVLPKEGSFSQVAAPPENLIHCVRQRMMADGYDERSIFEEACKS